jgi:hypothetical protein
MLENFIFSFLVGDIVYYYWPANEGALKSLEKALEN